MLLTQVQFSNDRPIPADVLSFEVVEQAASFSDETDQRPAGVVILHVLLQVARQMVDPVGKQCNLAFRAAGVLIILSVFRENLLF